MSRLFKRGRVWYARIGLPGGGTTKVTTGFADKKAAEKRAAELEREGFDPAHAAANKASTAHACDEFIGSRRRRERAEGTLHHYRVKLGHVVRLMPARLADITATACERFIETRLGEGAAQTTVKKEIRALGATLRHAKRQGLYMRDVDAVIPELEETYVPRERALTPWELVALVNALAPERAAQVVFIACTGARWSESVRAQRSDVDGPMVHLRGTKTARALRTVPVPPTMRGALAWALAHSRFDSDLLFAGWSNVRRDLGIACAAIGIAPVTPNDLRRTFATWLRQSGVTPDIIGAALGHTTSRMAELVYGRIKPADLDRLISERDPARLLNGPSLNGESPLSVSTGTPVGHEVAHWGGSEPVSAESVSAENPVKPSAQRQNRTADTGIFNPPGTPANVDESPLFAPDWDTGGPSFGARARRWFMRVAA